MNAWHGGLPYWQVPLAFSAPPPPLPPLPALPALPAPAPEDRVKAVMLLPSHDGGVKFIKDETTVDDLLKPDWRRS